MNAAVIIAVTLDPVVALAVVALGLWAAKAGVLTLRKPPRPPAPKETP